MLVVGLSSLADEGRRLSIVCGGGGGVAADLVDMTEALDAVARIGEAMQEFLAELLGFVEAPLFDGFLRRYDSSPREGPGSGAAPQKLRNASHRLSCCQADQ